MRKAKKAEILEILESLGRAHEEIKEELYRYDGFLVPNFQRAQKMLNECQEFAISLGKSIEKLEGEGHITVGCIESYCETIYEIYMEIDNANGREIHKNNILKHLKKQLITIENSVKNDIIVRKEVVFLPYKASMWDSMESVWMKARDDENSDAYVIAIPYFERNRDHSLGKMHYEGDKYPKDVPITD